MNDTKGSKLETFELQYKSFKEGNAKAPVVYKDFNVKVNTSEEDGKPQKFVVLSREEKDRDGETVVMDGMKLRSWIKTNGLPLIDSHKMYDGVVENGLGALRNLRVEEINGKKSLVGDPDFAPVPNGKIAEILYLGVNGGKPYFSNVSMGFAVYDYDNETRNILEWEPFEASLVTVGANMSARFMDKTAEIDEEALAKDLARFKKIREPFKEFTKLFLSDEFCERIGYKKDGDLLIDINSIYDIIMVKFGTQQEAPKLSEVAPQKLIKDLTQEQIDNALMGAIAQKLGV